MITHDEVRKKLDNAIMYFHNMDILYNYITQQERESKLLALYRKYLKYVNVDDIRYMQIADKIKELEDELK